MDFFKSVFAEDPDPPPPESEPESSSSPQHNPPTESSAADDDGTETGGGGWSFGGLVKTLTTRSESVLETYRRDLEEFGSGLKKETSTFREVASRAVKDLPSSIEISATKAQGAFSSIADIIAQGKETLLAPDLDSSDSSDQLGSLGSQSVSSGRYSRFEIQLRAIQCDVNTYVGDPEDVGDYSSWKLGFDLGEKGGEIEDLVRENGDMGVIYKKLVPESVDREGFWCRYFYRVHRLKQAESVRAKLVNRAISKDEDEEELTWDVDDDDDDDDDDEEEEEEQTKVDVSSNVNKEVKETSLGDVSADQVVEDSSQNVVDEKEKIDGVESIKEELSKVELSSSEGASEPKCSESSKKSDEEVVPEVKTEAIEAGKDGNVTVVPKQASPEEEDLGWDEIEDLGSDDDDNDDDDKRVASADGSSNRPEPRKRLSVAEDDEDLSWDIEDDDEPVKS